MKERNYSIDILKFVCAALIVVLHSNCKWHDAVLPLTRCAVPCFLMVSGFLLYSEEKGIGRERLLRNIKHIVHIILWSTALFAVVKEAQSILHDGSLFFPSVGQWCKFIVLNDNPFGFHLWYLGAYLYVLLIMLVVDKYKLWRLLFCLTPILLLSDLVLGKYSLLLLNQEFPYICVRNFLFVGIPNFMLGVWIKVCKSKLLSINKIIFGGGIILFSITSIIEKTILLNLNKCPAREHYLSTTFLAFCLFMFVLSCKSTKSSVLSKAGERDSLYIYIFHPLFLMVIPSIIKRIPNVVGFYYDYTAPLVAFILTWGLTVTLRKIKLIK